MSAAMDWQEYFSASRTDFLTESENRRHNGAMADEKRFSLRLPADMVDALDRLRKRVGGKKPSRTVWVSQAVQEKIDRDTAAKSAAAKETPDA